MNRISVPKNRKKDVSSACIRDIFLHRKIRLKKLNSYIIGKNGKSREFKEKILIYQNMSEIRLMKPPKQSKYNAGTKDIIKEFSKKSRRNFIKFLCMISDKLILWQDVTFADDVMQVRDNRKDVSNQTLNRFRRIVLDQYPEIKIAYKREWQPRKSGDLKGEYVPHFHMFISITDMNEESEIFNLAYRLAETWVNCTGTKEIDKAYNVARHQRSYRIIKSQKQALKYATKYITKPNENWTNESIGRSWGKIGKFNIPEPETKEVTQDEMVQIKRRLRKLAPKKHPIQKALKQKLTPTFLIVNKKTVNRILEHTEKMLEDECREYFKAKEVQN